MVQKLSLNQSLGLPRSIQTMVPDDIFFPRIQRHDLARGWNFPSVAAAPGALDWTPVMTRGYKRSIPRPLNVLTYRGRIKTDVNSNGLQVNIHE